MVSPRRRSTQPAGIGNAGVAALEFAILTPLLLLMILMVVGIGYTIQETLEIEQTLRVVGRYAFVEPEEPTMLQELIAYYLPSNASIDTPQLLCGCEGDLGGDLSTDCPQPAGTCGATVPTTYVRLHASIPAASTISSFLPFTTLPDPNATYYVRMQ